ncbi:MAG: hypothetical protein OGMRLDGQ_002725, partial [Candidatus Fervidibacter sp.]
MLKRAKEAGQAGDLPRFTFERLFAQQSFEVDFKFGEEFGAESFTCFHCLHQQITVLRPPKLFYRQGIRVNEPNPWHPCSVIFGEFFHAVIGNRCWR